MRTGVRKMMMFLGIVGGVLVALLAVGWLGLQVQPAPFADYPEASHAPTRTVAMPAGLPKPVENRLNGRSLSSGNLRLFALERLHSRRYKKMVNRR